MIDREEFLKINIFNKYLDFKADNASDKQKYALQLRDLILRWSNIYFYKDATYIYWKEITDTVFRIAAQDKEKFLNCDEFIKYLKVCLYHAKAEYYRTEEKKLINLPKGQKHKLKEIIEVITRRECEIQRQLSEYERVKYAAEWFNISEKKIRNYLDNIALINNNGSFDEAIFDNENEINGYIQESVMINQQVESENNIKIHEAFKSVLENRYKTTKPLICALFTAQKKKKKTGFDWLIDKFDWISEYFNNDIVEFYKIHGKVPTNKEIYKRMHPDVKNPDQAVSPHFSKFIKDFKSALLERNIRFFL
jgi:hypothetical protein